MKRRRDLKIKSVIDHAGALLALIGLGGIGGASEGHGSLLVALAIFIVGFSIVLWGYQR